MRKGHTGTDVSQLQRLLGDVGLKLSIDGWYGDTTEAAVVAFQRRVGLVVDGIAGPKTLAALRAGVVARGCLKQSDLDGAASRLGVPVASIMAINAVESRGLGFIEGGRPAILYERHQLHRLLSEAGADADAIAQRYPGLINRARGGYAGGPAEWSRLVHARQITADYPTLADQACSWGAFQIMGYHWFLLGYRSAADFVVSMHEGEAAHLDAFVRYIEADPALHKALKARKWADFARLHNGPAYKDNLYDHKLARAYEKYAALSAEVTA